MKTRRVFAVMVCLVLVGGTLPFVFGANEGESANASMKQRLNELLQTRVETAQLSFDATNAAYEAETATLSDLVTVMKNLVDARLAVAATPQEEIAVLKEHLTHAKNLERKIKLLYDVGSKGGEAKQYALAKFTRESAEIALLKARIKATP